MRLILVRHGQSEANAARVHSGWAQIPLTEKGREDALISRDYLRGLSIDRVYSSDLLRARQTCEIALGGIEPILTPLLREIGVGKASGLSVAACEEAFGEVYVEGKKRLDYRALGGESALEHQARAREFLRLLERDPAPCIVAFCHEGTMRCLRNEIEGLEPFTRHPCRNGGICLLDFDGSSWKVSGWNLPEETEKSE